MTNKPLLQQAIQGGREPAGESRLEPICFRTQLILQFNDICRHTHHS
ncbi:MULTISPECIES: hypothetical protein [Rhizobium/Agrobacterium group]|nr:MULTISPECIES: hypothetical protein [Rhizobium/Agrobacterium group]NSZ52728.1 hypothetical protein [Agrobacterium vitis]NTA31486.1 hypothetical protein [Agrobacterium vitis]